MSLSDERFRHLPDGRNVSAEIKIMVRVTHTSAREIKDETGKLWTVERTRVLFSGSEAVFQIWKQVHYLPTDAVVTKRPVTLREPCNHPPEERDHVTV